MGNALSTNIFKLVRSLGIVPHKKRQEFTTQIIEGMIKSRSVTYSQIADKIDNPIKTSSIERRIEDYFQKVEFNYEGLISFLLCFIHHDKLILSIDRTNWKYGETCVNIFCLSVTIGKMAVPLYFEMLDNNGGNSNPDDRIDLLQSVVHIIGKKRISYLVMDREFIGQKWLSWLKSSEIPFTVRVPKHHKILFSDGYRESAMELMENRKSFHANNVVVDGVSVNLSLSYDKDGELLYLIGTMSCKELKMNYKKRWGIEVFFQAIKKRGFNLEDSCIEEISRYRKLFALVCMAYTVCWIAGIEDGRLHPVRAKNHGYPQYSIFRRGLNLLRDFFKRKIDPIIDQIIVLIWERYELILKTVG